MASQLVLRDRIVILMREVAKMEIAHKKSVDFIKEEITFIQNMIEEKKK